MKSPLDSSERYYKVRFGGDVEAIMLTECCLTFKAPFDLYPCPRNRSQIQPSTMSRQNGLCRDEEYEGLISIKLSNPHDSVRRRVKGSARRNLYMKPHSPAKTKAACAFPYFFPQLQVMFFFSPQQLLQNLKLGSGSGTSL
jgi:hypothetical protein